MNARIGRLNAWWDNRMPRERVLLGIMAVLIVGVLLWLGVYRPLEGWAVGQAERRGQAEVRLDRLSSMGGEGALSASGPITAEALPDIARAAETRGFTPTLAITPGGRVAFSATSIGAGSALAWLDDLESASGVRVAALSIVEAEGTTVSIDGVLERR